MNFKLCNTFIFFLTLSHTCVFPISRHESLKVPYHAVPDSWIPPLGNTDEILASQNYFED